MSQCLYITFSLGNSDKLLHAIIQKKARSLCIEGTAPALNGDGKIIRISACGPKDSMEDFLDVLHKEAARESIKNMEIEPFIKEKDFRGVFRVIE